MFIIYLLKTKGFSQIQILPKSHKKAFNIQLHTQKQTQKTWNKSKNSTFDIALVYLQ